MRFSLSRGQNLVSVAITIAGSLRIFIISFPEFELLRIVGLNDWRDQSEADPKPFCLPVGALGLLRISDVKFLGGELAAGRAAIFRLAVIACPANHARIAALSARPVDYIVPADGFTFELLVPVLV